MKASLLKTIRHPESEKKRGKLNRNVVVFLICVVLSTFLWFMNMFSKKYTETMTFRVLYQHIPQGKTLYPSSETVNIKVSTSGFNIFAYDVGIKEQTINVDATTFKHKDNQYVYALLSHGHQEKIEEQLGEQMKLIDIAPDTLYLRPTQPQD